VIIQGIAGEVRDDSKIFPNPARDFFTVKTADNENMILQLYDMAGRLFKEVKSDGGYQVFDSSACTAGIYVLKIIHNDASVELIKLIIL
jgi:hypothetical protein